MVENVTQIKYGIECKNPKKYNVCKKGYVWNPTTRSCKNGKCLGSITGNSVIMCDEILKINYSDKC